MHAIPSKWTYIAASLCPTSSKSLVASFPATSLRTSSPPGCWKSSQMNSIRYDVKGYSRSCNEILSIHVVLTSFKNLVTLYTLSRMMNHRSASVVCSFTCANVNFFTSVISMDKSINKSVFDESRSEASEFTRFLMWRILMCNLLILWNFCTQMKSTQMMEFSLLHASKLDVQIKWQRWFRIYVVWNIKHELSDIRSTQWAFKATESLKVKHNLNYSFFIIFVHFAAARNSKWIKYVCIKLVVKLNWIPERFFVWLHYTFSIEYLR